MKQTRQNQNRAIHITIPGGNLKADCDKCGESWTALPKGNEPKTAKLDCPSGCNQPVKKKK